MDSPTAMLLSFPLADSAKLSQQVLWQNLSVPQFGFETGDLMNKDQSYFEMT